MNQHLVYTAMTHGGTFHWYPEGRKRNGSHYAFAGERIKIGVIRDKGYRLKDLVYWVGLGETVNEVNAVDIKDFAFTMPDDDVVIGARFEKEQQ